MWVGCFTESCQKDNLEKSFSFYEDESIFSRYSHFCGWYVVCCRLWIDVDKLYFIFLNFMFHVDNIFSSVSLLALKSWNFQ